MAIWVFKNSSHVGTLYIKTGYSFSIKLLLAVGSEYPVQVWLFATIPGDSGY